MSGNQFVMRRDTQKHTPPRPAPRPHALGAGPVQRHDRGVPHFWRDEERRPPPSAEGASAAFAAQGETMGRVGSLDQQAGVRCER